jgi:alpha,alpha-trehalase
MSANTAKLLGVKSATIKLMLGRTRQLLHVFQKGSRELDTRDVLEARKYITSYWKHLKRFNPKQDSTLIALPKPYVVPAYEPGREFDFPEQYYWDSYFISQGLLDNKHKDVVMGMLENLIFMFDRFHIIPNASRNYLTGRSHPPLLTSYIFDVYHAYDMDKKWLKKMIETAQHEYRIVWMGTTKPNVRKVYLGLSRYYDINVLNDLAEAESGWDMTTRFSRKCLDYLPIDLNALLYKYEKDFAVAAEILGNAKEHKEWLKKANYRKRAIDHLMWDNLHKTYFDFNYQKHRHSMVNSLASYYPMWAGMIDRRRAEHLVRNLRRFEHKGGLATTELPNMPKVARNSIPTQWAYPNGWAPLHFIVVKGLQRYGYQAEAKRIAMKWLRCNLEWFNQHGNFIEKYNVVNPEKPPVKGVYPTQVGFGWTNAVFERFCQDFIDKPQ